MYIDLTQTISEDMPVYPGTERPILDRTFNIKDYGFAETKISMFSHTGTHIDAPSHMVEGAKNLDEYPVDRFFGKAFLLDLKKDEMKAIEALRQELDNLSTPVDFLVIRTGWSEKWGSDDYFNDFPIPTKEVLELFFEKGLKGIGIDAISVDPVGSTAFENHMLIFGHDAIIIENLCNLDRIKTTTFDITLLPLKMEASDGMSARVVARVSE